MADLAVTYTLGSIVFNSGTLFQGSTTDLYWIATIAGLNGPVVRAPVDDVPFGDGGLIHTFWKGPRRVRIEGNLIVQSVSQNQCQEVFNEMEAALDSELASILSPNTATLMWTPTGGSAKSLVVSCEIPVQEYQPTDNYRLRSFSFQLVSAAADPS